MGLLNEVNPIDVIPGVVGAWNMEETKATNAVIDYSGNGNNGVPTGTSIVGSPFFIGKKARQFNGISDYIRQATISLPAKIVCLIKIRVLSTSATIWTKFLRSNNAGNGINFGQLSQTTNSSAAYIMSFDSNSLVRSFNATCININRFFAIGYNGANVYGGVDGNYSLIGAGGTVPDWLNQNLYIGSGIGAEFGNSIIGYVIFLKSATSTQIVNVAINYPDVTLEVGKVIVRKWNTNNTLKHGFVWEESQNNNLLTCSTHINMDNINS
jgi:hypothetical protein